MYGLNAVAFIFFVGINLLAYRLYKCSETARKKTITILCITLLFGNVFRYVLVYPLVEGGIRIPVEFSSVAYFVVPTILLITQKHARSWAAYSGLMAGFFYYVAMIVAGGPLYNAYPPYDIYISMFCHGTLYVCGLVMIGTEVYSSKDTSKIVLGIVLVAIRAMLLRPIIEGSERLFIYILLDGIYAKQLLPANIWNVALPIYYVAVVALVSVTIKDFFKRNQKQYRKYSTTMHGVRIEPD